MSTARKKKWFQCFQSGSEDPLFKEEVQEKLEAILAECENELLDEAARAVDLMDMEAAEAEAQVNRREEEMDTDTRKLGDEDLEMKKELREKREQLTVLEKERVALANEFEALTERGFEQKKAQEEGQYRKTVSLQHELEQLKEELDAKVLEEVRKAKEHLESQISVARSKLLELQDIVRKEQTEFESAVLSADRQKKEIQQLHASIRRQSLLFEERESVLNFQKDELEKLKQQNRKLLKNVSVDKDERLTERQKPKRMETAQEIRVWRSCQVPGFAVVGRDIDIWIDRTKRNVKACVGSFGPYGELWMKEYVPAHTDGVVCQMCCSAGPHNRYSCYVCRLLDISDSSLIP